MAGPACGLGPAFFLCVSFFFWSGSFPFWLSFFPWISFWWVVLLPPFSCTARAAGCWHVIFGWPWCPFSCAAPLVLLVPGRDVPLPVVIFFVGLCLRLVLLSGLVALVVVLATGGCRCLGVGPCWSVGGRFPLLVSPPYLRPCRFLVRSGCYVGALSCLVYGPVGLFLPSLSFA